MLQDVDIKHTLEPVSEKTTSKFNIIIINSSSSSSSSSNSICSVLSKENARASMSKSDPTALGH